MTPERDVDALIARYRTELTAEAELARGDLDEIEDHLRSLVADLRDGGMPLADAVATAAKRLGEPRRLAVEHTRVRTAFGARLSRRRAWSAAGLLIAALCVTEPDLTRGMLSISALELFAFLGLIAALIARRGWARAVVIGMLVPTLVVNAICLTDPYNHMLWFIVGPRSQFIAFKWGLAEGHFNQLAIVTSLMFAAFVVIAPWRARERSRRSIALSLLGIGYMGALGSLRFYADVPHVLAADPIGSLAAISTIAAIVGTIRGSAWAPLETAIAAIALGVIGSTALLTQDFTILGETRIAIKIGGVAILGAVASIGAVAMMLRGKLAPMVTAR